MPRASKGIARLGAWSERVWLDELTIGPPTVVTQLSPFPANAAYAPRSHDITRDGRRFLTVVDIDQASSASPTEIHVALNWIEELKQRVPTK